MQAEAWHASPWTDAYGLVHIKAPGGERTLCDLPAEGPKGGPKSVCDDCMAKDQQLYILRTSSFGKEWAWAQLQQDSGTGSGSQSPERQQGQGHDTRSTGGVGTDRKQTPPSAARSAKWGQ